MRSLLRGRAHASSERDALAPHAAEEVLIARFVIGRVDGGSVQRNVELELYRVERCHRGGNVAFERDGSSEHHEDVEVAVGAMIAAGARAVEDDVL